MLDIFDFIARPFAQLLMFLYNLTGSYGLALLLFAVAVKVVLLPFQMKAKKGTMKQSRLQPKLAEIQKRHGANKAKLNEEMQKMYKEEGVNPASGCLWGFLPLPILFALFQAIRHPITMMMGVYREYIEYGGAIYTRLVETGFESTVQTFNIELDMAQFITRHWVEFEQFAYTGLTNLQFELFGLMNLGQQPDWQFFWSDATIWSGPYANWLGGLLLFTLPLFSGGAQFISAGIMRKTQPAMPGAQEGAGKQMQTMMMMMPLVSVFFGFTLPAALSFYWTIGTVLQIFQDLWLNKKYTKILDAEDEERNKIRKAREAELEAKRVETERKRAEGVLEENRNKSKRKKQMTEKQERLEKTAEWEKKHAPPSDKEDEYEPSRVGKRRYARGRAYDPDRYYGVAGAVSEDSDNEAEDAIEAELLASGAVDYDGNVIVKKSSQSGDSEDYEDQDDNEFDEDVYSGDDEVSTNDDDDSESTVNEQVEDVSSEGLVSGAHEETSTVRFDTTRFEEEK